MDYFQVIFWDQSIRKKNSLIPALKFTHLVTWCWLHPFWWLCKNHLFHVVQGSYVPDLVKICQKMTSHLCQKTQRMGKRLGTSLIISSLQSSFLTVDVSDDSVYRKFW